VPPPIWQAVPIHPGANKQAVFFQKALLSSWVPSRLITPSQGNLSPRNKATTPDFSDNPQEIREIIDQLPMPSSTFLALQMNLALLLCHASKLIGERT